jgi:hypothetical protein
MAAQAQRAIKDAGRLATLGGVSGGSGCIAARRPKSERRGDRTGPTHLPASIRPAEMGTAGRFLQAAAASLTSADYPTKGQDFKNALREKSPFPEHAIPADMPGPSSNGTGWCWIPERTTCGKPVLCRTRQGLTMAEILKSFKPPYEISFGLVKLWPGPPIGPERRLVSKLRSVARCSAVTATLYPGDAAA